MLPEIRAGAASASCFEEKILTTPAWILRQATAADRDFLFELNRVALGPYVDAIWGWDEAEQIAYFDERFDPSRRQIVHADGRDVGELSVEDRADEIYVARIALLPGWQGRGIGSSIIASLLDRAAFQRKAVTLHVLHGNPRATRLYESLGFVPVARDETRTLMRAEPRST